MMRYLLPFVLLGMPLVGATQATSDCVPTSADPETFRVVLVPLDGGRTFYVEERGVAPSAIGPVPLSGALVGEYTWVYEEANTLAGLQRGGIPLAGETCFPAREWPLCLLLSEDPITDEHCGFGPDTTIMAIGPGAPPT